MRLPALGPRGEGWVAIQFVLFAGVALSAVAGRGWPDAFAAPAVGVGVALITVGVVLVVAGAAQLDSATWTPLPRPRPRADLVESGPYARARHPIYGGGILVAAGWAVIFASVVGALLTALLVFFFELKSRHEETLLAERSPDYEAYRARTPRRFLPWLY
jgi:protein-S-isoprenylcysteine O-methyltransferase Ste14